MKTYSRPTPMTTWTVFPESAYCLSYYRGVHRQRRCRRIPPMKRLIELVEAGKIRLSVSR